MNLRTLSSALTDLTAAWTEAGDVPAPQRALCREIGEKLHELNGLYAMRVAYYEAMARNRAAPAAIGAIWDGIGDWKG